MKRVTISLFFVLLAVALASARTITEGKNGNCSSATNDSTTQTVMYSGFQSGSTQHTAADCPVTVGPTYNGGMVTYAQRSTTGGACGNQETTYNGSDGPCGRGCTEGAGAVEVRPAGGEK
jgi:hypothetical protein